MSKIFKKLKGLWNLSVVGFLSLVFTNKAKAEIAVPMYGVLPQPALMYGVFPPTPGEISLKLLPFIGGVFLVFVIAPVTGLIWYRKHGGIKKWPSVIVWILAALFILALVVLIILLYPLLVPSNW